MIESFTGGYSGVRGLNEFQAERRSLETVSGISARGHAVVKGMQFRQSDGLARRGHTWRIEIPTDLPTATK